MFNSLLEVIIYIIFKEYGLGMILEHFIVKVRLAFEKPAPSPPSPRPGLQYPLRFFAPWAFLI